MMKKRILQVVILLVVFSTLAIFLIINKKILITPIFAGKYEMCGIDVSHYQGEIDWVKLSGQNLDFAFIKATEGSGHIDERFCDNWQEAARTELFTGAYHFFSFDSDGAEQAKWYIETVGSLDGNIAPAVDVEFYGDIADNPPPKAEVIKQLGELLDALEEHYRTKPIIYTTYTAYYTYLKDEFETYPLWIRNVYYQPLFSLGDRWVLWQYTDTAVLDGYEGTEQCIDMNVFRGTEEEWEKLLVQCCAEDSLSEEDRSREEVFDAVEEGDFSVVMKKSSDPERIVESLQEAYELDGDSKRTVRCDIDGDGLEELLLLIKYDLEGFERIDFILKYRNGGAVCAYYDWCDGNEWMILGEGGKLIHCLSSNNGSCYYYGMKECTLNGGGIKEIDYTGEGVEVCVVYEADDLGLWWWEGQPPPITQAGVYYTKLYAQGEKEPDGNGMMNGQPKELITKEQFCAECKELVGKEFTADIAPEPCMRAMLHE